MCCQHLFVKECQHNKVQYQVLPADYKRSAPTLGARTSVLMLAARAKIAFEKCGTNLVDILWVSTMVGLRCGIFGREQAVGLWGESPEVSFAYGWCACAQTPRQGDLQEWMEEASSSASPRSTSWPFVSQKIVAMSPTRTSSIKLHRDLCARPSSVRGLKNAEVKKVLRNMREALTGSQKEKMMQEQTRMGEYHWYEYALTMPQVGDLDEGGEFCIESRKVDVEGPNSHKEMLNVINEAVMQGRGDTWKVKDFMDNYPDTNRRKAMYQRVTAPEDGFLISQVAFSTTTLSSQATSTTSTSCFQTAIG